MSFETENVIIQDEDGVEYYVEQEDATVDGHDVEIEEEESVLLLVEDQDVDTFTCGACQTSWTDLALFLEHKKTPCRQTTDLENLSTTEDDSAEVIESVEFQLEENECETLSSLDVNDSDVQLVVQNRSETGDNNQVHWGSEKLDARTQESSEYRNCLRVVLL